MRTKIILITSFTLFFTSLVLSQEAKVIKRDTVKTVNSNLPNAPQAEQGDVKITDGTNTLIRITDEGLFGAIEIKSGVPSTTTDKLYNDSGTLKFNGSTLGGGSGATAINDLTDAKFVNRSLFLGLNAGANDTGGDHFNTAVGEGSLNSNTSGSANTGVGSFALSNNVGGKSNTANGYEALRINISGAYNSAFGADALKSNQGGNDNSAIGYFSQFSNISGNENISIGNHALRLNTTGNGNVAIGFEAGYNELGSNKLYIENSNSSSPLIWGDFATDSISINGNFHVTGNITSDGASLGATEINDLTDAKYDGTSLFVGSGSGINDDGTLNHNTAMGTNAFFTNITGYENTAIGSNALSFNTDGYKNTANGYQALYSNTTGNENTATGVKTLYNNTTGNFNTAIGRSALYWNTTGGNNTAVGYLANNNNSTNNNNTAIGSEALRFNGSGNNNTAVGSNALYQGSGNDNVAVGFNSLYSTNGNSNIGMGRNALYSNIQGSTNIAIGQGAMYFNSTGNNNVGIGFQTNVNNSSGSNNTILGNQAGGGVINTRDGSVFIGYQAGFDEITNDKLYIENSNSSSPLIFGDFANNRIVINGNSTDNSNNRTFFSNGNAGGTAAWFNDSDRRLKKNISTIPNALEKVKNLRGVNYEWISIKHRSKGMQMGFIAQEANEVIPEVVDDSGESYSMQYAPITALLVEAVKEQEASIKYQDQRIKKLEEENENLKKQFAKNTNLENKVELLEHALNKIIRDQQQMKVSKN